MEMLETEHQWRLSWIDPSVKPRETRIPYCDITDLVIRSLLCQLFLYFGNTNILNNIKTLSSILTLFQEEELYLW